MRHCTGLRNRSRARGRGAYSRLRKSRRADRYGKYVNGVRQSEDVIGKYVRAVDALQEGPLPDAVVETLPPAPAFLASLRLPMTGGSL